ncbi:Hpt domain-containing protein [Rhodopirellula bahusiensis]|uniref:Hpt domain-containing protein n=1 Tax=Rhodopirellula bahusiensis TaxID=2014065 RepID=UPI003265FAE3
MSSPDRIDASTAPQDAIGIYRLSETGRLIDASDRLLQIFAVESINGFQASHQDSKSAGTQIVPWHSPQSKTGQMLTDYFSRNLPVSQCRTDVEIDGQTRTLIETLVPIRNANGHLEQWLGTVQDVTAIQARNAAMVQTATTLAKAKETQLGELCDQVRWALDRVRDSIRSGDSACMTNALCDTIEHLVDLESETNAEIDVVSEAELQALKDRRQGFRLCELVEDLAESAASEIHRAGRRITVQIDHALPAVVRGNLQAIHCVLANLLHHAASHSDWGDVKLNVSKNGSRTKFAIRVTGHSLSDQSAEGNRFEPDQYPSEWKIASRYAQRLHSSLTPRILSSGCLEVAFDTALVEDTDLQSSQHPESVLGEHTRVLIVTAHTATRDALTEILAGWKIASSNCDELDVALQRIRINQKMGRSFDAILIDEAIFATRQTLSKETLECLATSANIRIQSRGTTCQSNFHHRLRAPDWVWTVSEPIRQGCLRNALIGATRSGDPDESSSCHQCHAGALHAQPEEAPVMVSQIEPPRDASFGEVIDRGSVDNSQLIESSKLLSKEALLEECGGDRDLFAVVMEVMSSSMPVRLNEMQTAAKRGDLESVRRLAHQMSGAAKDHSMTAVAELTTELTAHATSKDSDRVQTCVSALSLRVEQTIEVMQAMLEEAS